MNKKPYAAILDDIARGYVPDHIDLTPRILSQLEKRKHTPMSLRLKTLVATMVALLVIVAMLIRVPSIAEAMHQILGRFIPGIGIIETSEARVLAMPVMVTRDGITVTVEQLVADSQHTVVVYAVEGLSEPVKSTYEGPDCLALPQLRLPNGVEFSYPAGSSGSGVSSFGEISFEANYRFPGLPAGVNEVTLLIPCLTGTGFGKLPENWEIPLTLVPVTPEMTTYPIIEIAPTNPIVPQAELSLSTPMDDTANDTFTLSIERVIPLDDGYRIYGKLEGDGNNLMIDGTMVRLLDTNGQEIPGGWDISESPLFADRILPIVFNANIDYTPTPVTLVVDSVHMDIYGALVDGNNHSFTFDAGQNLQIDQEWEIAQDIQIGGYSLHIAKARFFERNGEYGFAFHLNSPDPSVHSARLFDFDNPMGRYGGVFVGYNGEPFIAELTYEPGFMPSGIVTIDVSAIMVTCEGPWKATVMLPASEETPNP
ncbi:MAG: DUF4179 domain-containing protein [Anaerolineae bacterium]|nr:DUF4179 domain-containing protein [Anaerolineae bacterium]